MLGIPILVSGRFLWAAIIFLLALVLAVQAASANIKEEDKHEIRYNIFEPEDIIAELEFLEEAKDAKENGRFKCLASLSALAKKHKKKEQSKNFPLLCQQAAYITLRLYHDDNEAVGSSIALLALVAKDDEVRKRNKYQADVYGLDRPIQALHGVLKRAKQVENEEREAESAEILRKGCLLLGALSDNDKDLDMSRTMVEEEGLTLILDVANWFRFHEDVANWAMWAIFILCFDNVQNKVQFVRSLGIKTVCDLIRNNSGSLEVTRHGVAILYDLLREGNFEEGKKFSYDPWEVRKQALASGLHHILVKAMSEFSDSMDIMMMGQEMLIGTGYQGDIPQFEQL